MVFFSMPKDILDYVNSYDEGERQANLEQSFRILFQCSSLSKVSKSLSVQGLKLGR